MGGLRCPKYYEKKNQAVSLGLLSSSGSYDINLSRAAVKVQLLFNRGL